MTWTDYGHTIQQVKAELVELGFEDGGPNWGLEAICTRCGSLIPFVVNPQVPDPLKWARLHNSSLHSSGIIG